MHLFHLMLNAAKEDIRYRVNFVGEILALLLLYVLQFVFFDVVSSLIDRDKSNGNWLQIFFMTYVLGGLTISFFSAAISGFFRQLTLGRVDVLLVRPVNLLVLILFRWCQLHYLLVALLFFAICVISNTIDFYPFAASVLNTGLYAVALIAGVVAGITFLLGLSSFAFITQRDLPVDYIHASIFTFALLPESFYSKVLLYVLVTTLPMVVFASVAMDVLYNGVTDLFLIFMGVASMAFFLVLKVVYRLFSRFDSIGG